MTKYPSRLSAPDRRRGMLYPATSFEHRSPFQHEQLVSQEEKRFHLRRSPELREMEKNQDRTAVRKGTFNPLPLALDLGDALATECRWRTG